MARPLYFATERDSWNIYRLEDGSVIKIKLVLTRIEKTGVSADGAPQYNWSAVNVAQIEPPETLQIDARAN